MKPWPYWTALSAMMPGSTATGRHIHRPATSRAAPPTENVTATEAQSHSTNISSRPPSLFLSPSNPPTSAPTATSYSPPFHPTNLPHPFSPTTDQLSLLTPPPLSTTYGLEALSSPHHPESQVLAHLSPGFSSQSDLPASPSESQLSFASQPPPSISSDQAPAPRSRVSKPSSKRKISAISGGQSSNPVHRLSLPQPSSTAGSGNSTGSKMSNAVAMVRLEHLVASHGDSVRMATGSTREGYVKQAKEILRDEEGLTTEQSMAFSILLGKDAMLCASYVSANSNLEWHHVIADAFRGVNARAELLDGLPAPLF
jgi:hypothetical protein